MFLQTTATTKIAKLEKRLRGIAGGTSASKTISILILLIDYAQTNKGETISIVSETMPHLKRGAIRDFLNIMQEHNYFRPLRWNRTDFIYTFETGTIMEFFSADQPGKVRGPRRDVLFINEANNISYETFTQLEIRTKKVIFLDWNPVAEFWWYSDVMPNQEHDFITLTYKDNEALDPAIVTAIESRKYNKNWWKVYGEGQLGEAEGRIYTGWKICDTVPEEARLERYGLDFGYTNDPTAIIALYRLNKEFILDEIIYRRGMKNSDIADLMRGQPEALIIADSAEPKSIDELAEYGLKILPSQKGQGSVTQGIQFVQDQKITVTANSVNLLKEYRNYLWLTNKDGKAINEPQDFLNHCLDGNTLVDTVDGQKKIKDLVGKEGYLYSEKGKIRKFYDVRQTGVEQIYEIEFTNGITVSCSAEHPFKLINGDWCPASLLIKKDLIQLVSYGSQSNFAQDTNVQQSKVLLWKWPIFSESSFKNPVRAFASSYLGISQGLYFEGLSHPSQGWGLEKQSDREFRDEIKPLTFERTYDTREEATPKGVDKRNKAVGIEVARLATRDSLSFQTWQVIMAKEREDKKKLLPLWQRIRYAISDSLKVLPPELQDESPTAQVKRITRKSFKRKVYNLEVEDTHSFSINGGIIVSNCLDALRYSLEGYKESNPAYVQAIAQRNKQGLTKWAI